MLQNEDQDSTYRLLHNNLCSLRCCCCVVNLLLYSLHVLLYWLRLLHVCLKNKHGIVTVRKRSWGKVMFLHLSVSHSVHRGGVCPSACWDTPPRQTPPRQTPSPQQTNTAGILLECFLAFSLRFTLAYQVMTSTILYLEYKVIIKTNIGLTIEK